MMRRITFVAPALLLIALACSLAGAEPLLDWSDWEKYRGTVQHPSGAFKPADVARARENLARYPWAQAHAATLERGARAAVARITPEYLAAMIPETTPGDPKFTPCPACRDLAKPVHPHGLWTWRESAPDQLACEQCRTVFPNEKYPESVVLRTTWGKPQTLTFAGGEPFVIFTYKTGRPSFSANIRARKVSHLATTARTLSEAYLLSGKTEYARAVRAILLRFAACYPGWLVHTGYGEYADMEPKLAAQHINALPTDELCPPPNRPDRRLHTGYWSAGRAGGVGQESGFIRRVVEAYDFTCTARDDAGAPLYSDADRRTIERDLLLEGTALFVSDKAINNKSVGNRTAAALVGLCVGHPGLVRFGWDGFQKTIDEWFLPDGTTSESQAYATMTLGNIWDMPQALRGYSEPEGYRGPDGQRRVAVDLYHGTAYEKIWENLLRGLQGDLTFPAFADSYRTSGLGAQFVELMAANYPERPEYLALLKEVCGPDLTRGQASLALYYREPGLEQKSAPPLTLPDWCPPDLRIGHMRTGQDGRESLLLLSASHWGGHHHLDSLNLTYWKKGRELLSDLGYLWDHPKKSQTARTLAHNTVLLDEKDQRTKERGGKVIFFRTSPQVKAMEAASHAYESATVYRRTSVLIDHGEGRSYAVDFFRVQGGATQDFVFHVSHTTVEFTGATAQPTDTRLYDMAHARSLEVTGAWCTTWQAGGGITAVAWSLPQPGEQAFVTEGWGQRDWRNSDLGATLPYIVRRTTGEGLKTFASVFEGHSGSEPFVRNVTRRSPDVVEIETALGLDTVTSHVVDTPTSTSPRLRVISTRNGKSAWEFSAR
ncbi:MAG: heparinase II/III family protein [Verrucomicrobiota bacterium]